MSLDVDQWTPWVWLLIAVASAHIVLQLPVLFEPVVVLALFTIVSYLDRDE
jgi:hypothetical protein